MTISPHKLRRQIQTLMHDLRRKSQLENKDKNYQSHEVVFSDSRLGYLNKRVVHRLVLFLRGSGCSWAKSTGGCTFCGFWNATQFGEKISDHDYIQQVQTALENEKEKIKETEILCLYNDGSLLEEKEISFSAVQKIISFILNKHPQIKKIVLEAKITDINEKKIASLSSILADKKLEIAVGFESSHPTIRDYCINKRFTQDQFLNAVEITNKYNVDLTPLILLKPPFLTEAQAIQDVLNSLIFLEKFSFNRIDLEMATIESNTITELLWKNNLYKTPWLWSVIDLLLKKQNLNLKTPVYISPSVYTVKDLEHTSNCPQCTSKIHHALVQWNLTWDEKHLKDLSCICKQDWQNEVNSNTSLNAELLLLKIQNEIDIITNYFNTI